MLYCADRRCSNSGMPCANYCQHVFLERLWCQKTTSHSLECVPAVAQQNPEISLQI